MTANGNSQEQFYLKPGELYAGCRPARVTTVVGSCVAVTMYHKQMNVAIMCHAMQPACPHESSGCRDACREKFKIVRCVINEMIDQFKQIGVPKEGVEVKLFGGSVQFTQKDGAGEKRAIGQQNIEAALEMFSANRIRLNVVEVGGGMGRKLIFDTNSGVVYMKRVGSFCAKNLAGTASI